MSTPVDSHPAPPRFPPPAGQRCARVARWLGLGLAGALAATATGGPAAVADEPLFRMGMSAALMVNVNENDAKAAVKVWAQSLSRQIGINASPEVHLFDGAAAITDALRTSQVDMVAMTTIEYLTVSRAVAVTDIISERDESRRTIHILLVRKDAPFASIADLRGRQVRILRTSRTALALVWLEVLLARQGCPRPEQFFGNVTISPKPASVVLPVFFGSADACIVDQAGFETMAELNPQIRLQLRTLASSAILVEGLSCFRADLNPQTKERLISGLRHFHETPAGNQILTVYQAHRMDLLPPSALDATRALIAEYERFFGPVQPSMPVLAPPPVAQPAPSGS